MPVAIVTGASRGLGRALAHGLAHRGWSLVIDARGSDELLSARRALEEHADVIAVTGDVTDTTHRHDLVDVAVELGGVDLLVNNAGVLGPSPQPALADYPLDVFGDVLTTNVTAPLALTQVALPHLRAAGGAVLNLTSDAAREPYPGWGGYGASKAALEQLSAILAAEEPDVRIWWVDPGDLRTRMHQAAFPGEDISDRPLPEEVVPALLGIVIRRPPSGRYTAAGEPAPAEVGAR